MDKDPLQRITGGYAAAEDPDARPRRRLAEAYRPSAHYERLLELRESDPAAWSSMPASERISAGMYLEQKAAHEQLQEEGAA